MSEIKTSISNHSHIVLNVDPDPQTRKKSACKQELIIQNLLLFYGNRSDLKEILEVLEGNSKMSLRLIDWFVTNYAKKYNICYIVKNQKFFVYNEYKNQLKAYSKKLFDPFCRRERILFQVADIVPFETTVGKLNFFRWAINNNVLEYIETNLQDIENEMNESARELQKIRKEEKTKSTQPNKRVTRRKLNLVDISRNKTIQKYNSPIEVVFD
jgi:hypothetical protein